MRLTWLRLTTAFVSLLILFFVDVSFAQVRQSTSFQIESDSINIGGGRGSSTLYLIEDTVGEQATGRSESASFQLRAGYQQMQEIYLAITSAPADVTMSPSIGGVTGGTANGSTTLVVTTDNRAGYQLYIEASDAPAMQSASSTIANYDPGASPSYLFTTNATDAHFGFSPEGEDIIDRFKDDGTIPTGCNNGGTIDSPDVCWDGVSTTAALIAERTSSNNPSGSTTTLKFRVGIGSTVNQQLGTYVATTTITALPL